MWTASFQEQRLATTSQQGPRQDKNADCNMCDPLCDSYRSDTSNPAVAAIRGGDLLLLRSACAGQVLLPAARRTALFKASNTGLREGTWLDVRFGAAGHPPPADINSEGVLIHELDESLLEGRSGVDPADC